jgi:hypothetical protein
VLSGQFAHERTLPHRGETNEANTSNTSTSNIETDTSAATAATAWLEQLPLEFREFCFQLTWIYMSMPTCVGRPITIPRWKDVALFFWVLAICDRGVSRERCECGIGFSYFGLNVLDLF